MTDRAGPQDVLHLIVPGPLPAARLDLAQPTGAGRRMAQPGIVVIAQARATSLFVLAPRATAPSPAPRRS